MLKNARPDLMRSTLALLLLLSFQFALAALFKWRVPVENRDMVIYMLGQLSGMVTTAIAFYFATSKSSVDKQAVIESYGTASPPADAPMAIAPVEEKA